MARRRRAWPPALPAPAHAGAARRGRGRAQVATRERVWLVDLLALRGGPGLAAAVPALLRAPAAVKLGCGLAADLGVLVRGAAAAGYTLMYPIIPYTLPCARAPVADLGVPA
jgi:hypothetical protein